MSYIDEMKKYQKTAKQKEFGPDFLVKDNIETMEFWDTIEIGKESEVPIKFEVKAEDMMAYAEGVPDDNKIFYDAEYARKCGHDGLVAHPMFGTQIAFWVLRKGHGSWIRTPGARNPGQIIEWFDPIRVGDIITVKQRGYDKWEKRGKFYVRYVQEYYDQKGNLKTRAYGTLILPRTKEDVMKFVKGERGLKV